jgi:23S rRNA (pseudouridine1915-N3)-methyltransferase
MLKEIAPAKRSKSGSVINYMAEEAVRLQQAFSVGNPIKVVLDERGSLVDTKALSKRMEQWLQSGRDVVFIVGGADGLATEIKQQADWMWSLTPLTLPHPMVRIILAEQLYRAYSLLNNHPYHRE